VSIGIAVGEKRVSLKFNHCKMNNQLPIFQLKQKKDRKKFKNIVTITNNLKGHIDIDTVKGCSYGMQKYPNGGCYDECYAYKIASRYGFDFSKSVSRKILDREHLATMLNLLKSIPGFWYRIGTLGDPCHDWKNTITIINALRHANKIPVIITKHWIRLNDDQILKLKKHNVVFNTSISPLDTDDEIKYRVTQFDRLKFMGCKSILRIVTCKFGNTKFAKKCNEKQNYLLSMSPIIDNPLRIGRSNKYVENGDIVMEKNKSKVGGNTISLNDKNAFVGKCDDCPDQCGVDENTEPLIEKLNSKKTGKQSALFNDKIEFIHAESVIGSGYEDDVSKLALEDGIAHRAARKNMQIHSAIILLINEKFSGFFTFQNNHESQEFCLLQSVITPEHYSDDLYRQMATKVIECNTKKYPAIMTTNPKSKFETPKVYESLGFKTYLKMSGFEYMVNGKLSDVRLKVLAHCTMVNVWDSAKGEFLKIKREWKARIEAAGEKHGVENPQFASREGCWQGEAGFSNVVTGRSFNKNASVLDAAVCEIVLRFFMPKDGKRVYNPFGGGVQMGYVCGYYGYNYVASEIRQNQCDVNNLLCSDFKNINWIKSDSSSYKPKGKFDLVFTCPPYYRVEKYLDYDGLPPEGEINHLPTYEEFMNALFSGYKIAIDHLNDNSFFVVMIGDSRDNDGGFRGSEAETELFLRDNGLLIYNKITYLEPKFTRLAQAKITLHHRKFPKAEQKIIVGFKGDHSKIKDLYSDIGRL
jgi:hypothetical protein